MDASETTPSKGETVSDVEDYEQLARRLLLERLDEADLAATQSVREVKSKLKCGERVTTQDATDISIASSQLQMVASAVDELARLEGDDE